MKGIRDKETHIWINEENKRIMIGNKGGPEYGFKVINNDDGRASLVNFCKCLVLARPDDVGLYVEWEDNLLSEEEQMERVFDDLLSGDRRIVVDGHQLSEGEEENDLVI